jgi:pimeloyl-ACP methyl ester carboxylesterase
MVKAAFEPRSRQTVWRLAWIACATATLLGCGFMQVKDQSERIAMVGTLSGKVTVEGVAVTDVVVALLQKDPSGNAILYRTLAPSADGTFSMKVAPADYLAGAFVDQNHDGHFQPGEPGQFFGKPTFVSVPPSGSVKVEIHLTASSTPQPIDVAEGAARQAVIGRDIGVVTTLDDPRFAPENGVLGMWRPIDFIDGPRGGLFLLGEYDPKRIPVLFVHGISDTPRTFAKIIEGLDPQRFQAWVAYYPSGIRLEPVTDILASAMHQLQRRYGFKQYVLVAHSMGGLVSRAFIQQTLERYPDEVQALRLFVTVNSPFGGMDSAATAVEHSPVVVPAWQDVATGSEFIAQLMRQPLPRGLPYYLVFSFHGDENGDGVVSLPSQLPSIFQSQATRLYGFRDTHVGTLSDPAFIALLNQLLDQTFAASQPPKVAGPEPVSVSPH